MSTVEESGLSSYAELASIVEELPLLVRETRRGRRQSMREAARRAGLSASTFSRLESGEHGVDQAGLVALLRWMDDPAVDEETSDGERGRTADRGTPVRVRLVGEVSDLPPCPAGCDSHGE